MHKSCNINFQFCDSCTRIMTCIQILHVHWWGDNPPPIRCTNYNSLIQCWIAKCLVWKSWPQTILHSKMNLQNSLFSNDHKSFMMELLLSKIIDVNTFKFCICIGEDWIPKYWMANNFINVKSHFCLRNFLSPQLLQFHMYVMFFSPNSTI